MCGIAVNAGYDINQHFREGTKYIPEGNTLVEYPIEWNNIELIKLMLAKGASLAISLEDAGLWKNNDPRALLLFVAGLEFVPVKNKDQHSKLFFPSNWEDLDLKNQCRKAIRQHLLALDHHTNLLIQVPQLQMTNEKPGLPQELVSYLLWNQTLEVDWDRLDKKGE